MRPLRAPSAVFLIAAPMLLLAQEPASFTPEERAAMTARRIAAAIGLDERATDKATGLLIDGEHQVAELRARMDETQREIDAQLIPYFEQLSVTLEPDQAAKLEALLASGALSGCCLERTAQATSGDAPGGSTAEPPTTGPAKPARTAKTTGGAK
ncbi:MAG: hypothetical protein IT227_13170 [Flavobacteriales bacterium]|jgi:hypothetical protein|nr:hypothetical protein [Flavobacteriales bacterium]